MPNWCSNNIVITGDKETLTKIWEECFDDGILRFTKIVPYPEGMIYSNEGYNWCYTNWGVKWDLSKECGADFELHAEDGAITGWFETAWTFPGVVMKALSKKYPVHIELDFDETGMCFMGNNVYKNGEETSVYYLDGDDYPNHWQLDDEEE